MRNPKPQRSNPIKACAAAVLCFLLPAAAEDTATRTAVEVAFRASESTSKDAALVDAVVVAIVVVVVVLMGGNSIDTFHFG